MAHWVGILNGSEPIIITGKTKEEVIFDLSVRVMGRSKYAAHTISNQLKGYKESVAVAYGTEGEQVAKVFLCSCGSIKRHTEIKEKELEVA